MTMETYCCGGRRASRGGSLAFDLISFLECQIMIAVPYKFEPDLSAEEFMKLGQLSIRWSHIEYVLGMCLKRMLRLTDDEAIIVVFPLSLDQRLTRIRQLAKSTPVGELALGPINELKLIMPAIQYVRNNVIHAFAAEGEFRLHSKQRTLTKAEVFSAEELTNYAAHVTVALRYALGFEFDTEGHSYTLPDRPEIPSFCCQISQGFGASVRAKAQTQICAGVG